MRRGLLAERFELLQFLAERGDLLLVLFFAAQELVALLPEKCGMRVDLLRGILDNVRFAIIMCDGFCCLLRHFRSRWMPFIVNIPDMRSCPSRGFCLFERFHILGELADTFDEVLDVGKIAILRERLQEFLRIVRREARSFGGHGFHAGSSPFSVRWRLRARR